MTRFQEIKGLSEYVAMRISENGEEWQKFLDCAARFTPYSFKDQMLIYAQRPDATACATMDYWNDKMNCWVFSRGECFIRFNSFNIKNTCFQSLPTSNYIR